MNPKMTDNITRAFIELGATSIVNGVVVHGGKNYHLNPYQNIGLVYDRFVFDASVSIDQLEGESLSYFVNVPARTCTVVARGYQYHFPFSSYRDLVAHMVDDAALRDGLKQAKVRRDDEQATLDWFLPDNETTTVERTTKEKW